MGSLLPVVMLPDQSQGSYQAPSFHKEHPPTQETPPERVGEYTCAPFFLVIQSPTHAHQDGRETLNEEAREHETESVQDALFLALGGLIRKELNASQILERFVDVITNQLEADRGTVFLLDDTGDELVSIAAHLPELQEIRVPLAQGVAGWVARTGQIANIPSSDIELPIWREIDQQTGYTTHSMLAGPLYDRGENLIGVVQLLNKREGIFTKEDEQVFLKLASQAATLLEETTLSRGPNYVDAVPAGEQEPPQELPIGDRFNRIIGTSEPMRQVFRTIRRVAPTEANVLLRGQSGTGKGVIARALHHNSPRSEGPLVHVDCTTLPEGLMENELFGHERGAYTGAHNRQIGKVEAANRGTLFLDEIGDLPPQLQGKLLTLIQERTFRRVGGTELQRADIRIITATNRPLEQLVQSGQFREDLYFRLRVVQIELPPLRDRGREDLLRLINHFVAEASKRHGRTIRRVRPDALELLLSYGWPGNVRELENCLESAVIFADDEITPSSLPLPRQNSTQEHAAFSFPQQPPTRGHTAPFAPFQPSGQYPTTAPPATTSFASLPASLPPEHAGHHSYPNLPVAQPHASSDSHEQFEAAQHPFTDEPTLRELEGMYIRFLLERHGGNRSACARIMDIGRNTLLRKIKEHDIDS